MDVSKLSLLMLVSSLCGCGPAATEGGFDSANSAARMYAIEYAARDGDRTAIPRLVEQLNADDEAVRALAIASLQRLTGQTKGYRDYDPIEIRRDAVARWVQAVHAGEFDHPREELNTEGHGEPRSGATKAESTKHKPQSSSDGDSAPNPALCFVLCAFPFSPPPPSVFIRVHPWFPFSGLSPWPSVALRVSNSTTESHRG